MNKHSKESQEADFADFVTHSEMSLPSNTADKILAKTYFLLNPSPAKVFFKILSMHIVMGYISLSFCHQFDMNPFQTSGFVSKWMMDNWGHTICTFLCGFIFISVSVWSCSFLFSREEFVLLSRYRVRGSILLGTASLMAFVYGGANVFQTITALWFLGFLLGFLLSMEFSYLIKFRGRFLPA